VTYFILAKCLITGEERKFRASNLHFANTEQAREWVSTYFRNLELIRYEEWDEAAHGGILFRVQRQYVQFDVPKPELAAPDPKRCSLLISRIPRTTGIPRKRLLTP
jgi:hypothetical protein